jgi:hypothetical protein
MILENRSLQIHFRVCKERIISSGSQGAIQTADRYKQLPDSFRSMEIGDEDSPPGKGGGKEAEQSRSDPQSHIDDGTCIQLACPFRKRNPVKYSNTLHIRVR